MLRSCWWCDVAIAGWRFADVICARRPLPRAAPIPVKVVVVTMFERGEDTGDTPGEYQLWVEREHLDQIFPHAARLSPRAHE